MAVKEKDILKPMMSIFMAIIMVSILSTVVLGMQPAAPTYCCPLETDICFYTYDELYAHFTTTHPTEPIEIIWGD